MSSPQVWFSKWSTSQVFIQSNSYISLAAVTGASTGFGRSMTELVLVKGGIAIATLRTPSALDALRAQWPEDKLIVLELDVTKREDINVALEHIKAKVGRIDFVFNNAGYGLMGEVEGTPEDAARAMFEVNFWGAAYVAREAVKFFRDVNQPQGGTLLNVSSYMGLVAQPLMGYYVASKHGKYSRQGGYSGQTLTSSPQPLKGSRRCYLANWILHGTSRYDLDPPTSTGATSN